MRKRIIYGIIKTYKGIFVKKHVGNVQIFIIEMGKTFWVLNILGEMEDGRYVSQMLLRAPSEYIDVFIDDFEESENFVQLEEIFCDIPKESEDKFKIILKKKGRYLNSHYIISFSNEYSEGDIRIYFIEGKFKAIQPDNIKNKIQMKMKALKKKTIAKPLMSKFMASIKKR